MLREMQCQPRKHRFHGWTWLLGAALLVAGFLISSLRTATAADVPPGSNATLAQIPPWQRYLKQDCPGIVILSPRALSQLPSAQPFLQDFNKSLGHIPIFSNQKGLGVPVQEFEFMLFVPRIKPRDNGKPGTGEMSLAGLMFRLHSPEHANTFLRHHFKTIQTVTGKNGTYFVAKKAYGDLDIPFLRPDPQTIVVASTEQEADEWLAKKEPQDEKLSWIRSLPKLDGIASAAFDLKSLRSALKGDLDEEAKASPELKLVINSEGVVVGMLDASDLISVRALAMLKDESMAKEWKEMIDGLVGFVKLTQAAGALTAQGAKGTPDQVLRQRIFDNIAVVRVSSEIEVKATADLTVGWLLKEMVGKAEIKVEEKKPGQ